MADSSNVITVTDDNFQAETSSGVTLVDFWAVWCGPCRLVAPIVEQLADEYAGRVKVGKLDVDHNPRSAAQYNVRSIPTIMFFKDGQVADQIIGAVPRPILERKIQELLAA